MNPRARFIGEPLTPVLTGAADTGRMGHGEPALAGSVPMARRVVHGGRGDAALEGARPVPPRQRRGVPAQALVRADHRRRPDGDDLLRAPARARRRAVGDVNFSKGGVGSVPHSLSRKLRALRHHAATGEKLADFAASMEKIAEDEEQIAEQRENRKKES